MREQTRAGLVALLAVFIGTMMPMIGEKPPVNGDGLFRTEENPTSAPTAPPLYSAGHSVDSFMQGGSPATGGELKQLFNSLKFSICPRRYASLPRASSHDRVGRVRIWPRAGAPFREARGGVELCGSSTGLMTTKAWLYCQ
jgi:hypothetical protein